MPIFINQNQIFKVHKYLNTKNQLSFDFSMMCLNQLLLLLQLNDQTYYNFVILILNPQN